MTVGSHLLQTGCHQRRCCGEPGPGPSWCGRSKPGALERTGGGEEMGELGRWASDRGGDSECAWERLKTQQDNAAVEAIPGKAPSLFPGKKNSVC